MRRIVAAISRVLGITAVLALFAAPAHAEGIAPELLTGWMQNLVLSDPARPAPVITVLDTAGTKHGLEDFRGCVVLLNIFATWCAPCRREMPSLDRLAARLAGDDFVLIGISQDRKGADVYLPFPRRARGHALRNLRRSRSQSIAQAADSRPASHHRPRPPGPRDRPHARTRRVGLGRGGGAFASSD